MARGIWKNSLLKIFLTRSPLGDILRPLLYTPKEHIHYTFLESMNIVTAPIFALHDLKNRGLTYFWIFDMPRTLFEEVFFPDDEEEATACSGDFFKAVDGEEPAYLTQAYAWFYLEYLLKAHDSVIAPYSKDLENLAAYLSSLFAPESKVFYYHNCFMRLLAAVDENRVQEEAAIFYITEITNPENRDFLKAPARKCIWKLENAKYSMVSLINYWQQTYEDRLHPAYIDN